VQVEVLEGERPVRRIAVAGDVDEQIGLSAYLDSRALARLLREQGSVSGAFLRIDAAAADELHARLKRLPAVAGATTRLAALESFEGTIKQSFSIFTTVLVLFACAIAAAMVYNAARIALSERGRELASLRVLGFTRREIAVLLLGEQALLTLLALPVGFAIGWALCMWIGSAYQRELFAIPLIVRGRSYLFALAVVVAAALVSAGLVRRRLDRLDLVAVLKTRE
jgi:putative ABC transport system permease protein